MKVCRALVGFIRAFVGSYQQNVGAAVEHLAVEGSRSGDIRRFELGAVFENRTAEADGNRLRRRRAFNRLCVVNRNASQRRTALERFALYFGHSVKGIDYLILVARAYRALHFVGGELDGFEPCAVLERGACNGRDRRGNGYAFERGAVHEHLNAYAAYTLGKRHRSERGTAVERRRADFVHRVGNCNRRERRTVHKRVFAYRGNVRRDIDARNRRIVLKRVFVDFIGTRSGQSYVGSRTRVSYKVFVRTRGIEQEVALGRKIRILFTPDNFGAVVRRNRARARARKPAAGLVDNFKQTRTAEERPVLDCFKRGGKGQTDNIRTARKSFASDCLDSRGKVDAFEQGAVFERVAAYRGDIAVRVERDLGERGAVFEHARSAGGPCGCTELDTLEMHFLNRRRIEQRGGKLGCAVNLDDRLAYALEGACNGIRACDVSRKVIYDRNRRTAVERARADVLDVVGYCYRRKSCTAAERVFAYGFKVSRAHHVHVS